MNPELNFQISSKIAELFGTAATEQQEHYEANGRYLQKLSLQVPVTFPGTLRYAIDEYNGPNGSGYVLRAEYQVDGELWVCRRQTGPEAERECPLTKLL